MSNSNILKIGSLLNKFPNNGSKIELSKELKDKLVSVVSAYGKSNSDKDRDIIKDKTGKGNDFQILNAGYKLNSSFGKYEEDFTSWRIYPNIKVTDNVITTNGNFNSTWFIYKHSNENEINEMNIKVSGIPEGGIIRYFYIPDETATMPVSYNISEDGVYHLPKSKLSSNRVSVGFTVSSSYDWNNIRIEQIPLFKGAFTTDGIDDLIVSTKTIEEMGITDEVTVISMIHQIDLNSTYTIATTNYIENSNSGEHVRSDVYNYGKTGIYGYSASLINNTKSDIKNILGDKADYYVKSTNSLQTIFDAKFSVVGRISKLTEASQVAWYWTFIAKRVLTTDEINQVIAYYNLDKYVKPDIYYNVKKQGLTNDNHAQFGDKLIDYSGNRRDLQLFNIGWNPGSGIGKYVTNFGIWSKDAESKISYNSYSFTVNGSLKRTWLMWYVTELPSFKIKVSGINSNGYVDYGYYDNGSLKNFRLDKDGIHTLPPSGASSNGHGFKVNDTSLDWTGLVIEQIPDFAGALCFDGVDDFGINKDVPTFTDFTVIAKRTWLEENTSDKPFIIKGDSLYPDGNQNAFLFEYGKLSTYSFGQNNKYDESVVPSLISYATTYSYNGVIPLVRGSATDTIGIDVAHSTKIALYFLMLFPYSMSEFLIERQLKKHKLGTLYPGMVEFRPIISGRTDLIKEIKWYSDSWSKRIYVGDYIPRGVDVTANILLNDNTSELVKATYGNNYTEVRKQANWSETNNEWDLIIHNIGKSPQKIGITIDKYIRFEDIVQPYPAKFRFTDVDSGQVYNWGSKIKVGSTIKILSNVDIGNYLSDIYTINGYKYNGNIYSYNELKELTFLITNQPLEFASRKTYKLGGSEPKVILYPERLKLSNDTYKRLGYIPDLTGNGNHGVFNNLAFTEESGVNEDGSVHLDGVDDYISIPTLSKGGKQVLMKVNWQSEIGRGCIYDQRKDIDIYEFAIFNLNTKNSGEIIHAYQSRNDGKTYIDGILNNNILVKDLQNIIHNITITNELINNIGTISPVIGKTVANTYFMQMAFYDFMLFDEINTDEEIKQLNNIIGIEGNFVEWNPTITANVSSTYAISPNIKKSDGIIVKLVKGNIYSTSITGNLVLDIVPPNKDLDEVTNVIIDGKSYTPIKYQSNNYYRVEIPLIFPQEINVIIDEYITYETIEQPYPIFLNYIDKETNKAYTWGDKVKVDSILKISGYKNLFENGDTSLGGSNGYSVNGSSELIALGTLLTSEILVNKINTGVRSSVIWNLNTPKPLFAYDPSIINNVGLKNLGYLPDITGQGRHLLLNEFAYEGMSGVNGYPVVLGVNKTWETVSGTASYTSYITSNNIHVTHVERANNGLLYSYVKLNGELTNIKEIPSFKVNIKGLEGNSRVRYYYLATENATSNSVLNLKNGINEISKSFIPTDTLLNNSNNVWIGFSISAISDEVNSFDCDITIEILPNYEGTLCFDGINDYGIVSNLPSQYIKTLLMKVNWMKDTPMLLYDQRGGNYFGILTTQESDINNTKIAYQARNPNGKTYIDGIENNYIETYTLKDITHNITITNSNVNTIVTPVIGSNSGHSANFAQMAMYKVMGLPEIPSDEEIKTINNWAGIEAKVELPSYYWDAYGKTNLDADRGYIKDQVSLQLNNDNTNNNSLENFNFDYEGMSGYNGYPAVFGTNKTYANLVPNDGNFILTSSHNIINVTKFDTSYGLLYSHIKLDGKLTSRNIDYPSYKIKVTGLGENFGLHYSYLESSSDTTVKGFEINNDGIYIIPKSFASDGSLTSNSDWIGFIFTGTAPESCNVTIEVLPEYENGLAYDGVSDFSQNTEIEVVEDFTFLVKGSLLKGLTGSGGCIARKGDKKHYDTGGYAFIYCFDSPIESYRNSYYSFGKSFVPSKEIVAPPLIGYMTKTNVNGKTTTFGTNSDIKGIIFGNWSSGYMNMVIYKSIFYTKTISLLEINFLKNLMEKDEIINLNNPIFIQK